MEVNLQERIEQSRTRLFKVVFPNTTNHYNTLFGGNAMQLMDEAAFIAATRFSRKKMVTVSSGQIDFNVSIPADTIMELVAEVIRIGNTSLDVRVDIFQEEMYRSDTRRKSISGVFTFVALDQNNIKTQVL